MGTVKINMALTAERLGLFSSRRSVLNLSSLFFLALEPPVLQSNASAWASDVSSYDQACVEYKNVQVP